MVAEEGGGGPLLGCSEPFTVISAIQSSGSQVRRLGEVYRVYKAGTPTWSTSISIVVEAVRRRHTMPLHQYDLVACRPGAGTGAGARRCPAGQEIQMHFTRAKKKT